MRGISHFEANVASALTLSSALPRDILRALATAPSQHVERFDRRLVDDGPGLGQPHRAAGALEQLDPELLLDLLDLMADRGRRQAELVRGAGEIQHAGRRLEGPQRAGAGHVRVHDR